MRDDEAFLQKRLVPLRAVLAAAAAGFIAEAALRYASGSVPQPDYLAFCGAVTLAAAVLVGGLVATVGGGLPLALAAWSALNGFFDFSANPGSQALLTSGFFALTWGALAVRRNPQPSATSAGVGVALTLIVVVIVWPRVLPRVVGAMNMRPGIWTVFSFLGAFGLVLLSHSLYARFRSTRFRVLSETWISVAAIIALVASAPAARRLIQLEEVRNGSASSYPGDSLSSPLPSIILLVLDTVRADHLSVYGYERDTTPALRRFVDTHPRTAVFQLAFSPANWTIPSFGSLFTGQLPSTHGANNAHQNLVEESRFSGNPLVGEQTLAEVMRDRGYRTAAIFANGWLSIQRGFERGFDLFVQPPPPRPLFLIGEGIRRRFVPFLFVDAVKAYSLSSAVNAEALRFLEGCPPSLCFLVANYMDAHAPYAPNSHHFGLFSGEEGLSVFAKGESGDHTADLEFAKDRYDEEIHALDAALEPFLGELERRGTLDRSWLIITADHGEGFGEHGCVQHRDACLYNAVVRVPLIIHPPRGEKFEAFQHAVSLVDLTATISAIAGAEPLGIGRDLRKSAEQGGLAQMEFFNPVDQATSPQPMSGSSAGVRAVVLGDVKLIEHGREQRLYRLSGDLEEQVDLAGKAPDDVRTLAKLLPPLKVTPSTKTGRKLMFEEQERLRALGYLE